MPNEWTHYDKKSLRLVDGPRPNFQELALDCVAFATAHGGSTTWVSRTERMSLRLPNGSRPNCPERYSAV